MLRIYETNLDYATVEKIIQENSSQFQFRNLEGKLLNFRLPEFSGNLLQLSGPKHFLLIHGLKPYDYLRDLQIMKALSSKLSKKYPDGITFKFYKEVPFSPDWKEMHRLGSYVSNWYRSMENLLRSGGKERRQTFLSAAWRRYENNEGLRAEFAESMNNTFSFGICNNGFCMKPDGSLIPDTHGPLYQTAPELLNQFVSRILQSGFYSLARDPRIPQVPH